MTFTVAMLLMLLTMISFVKRVNFDAVLGISKWLSECLYSYICLIVDHNKSL